jgi:alkane 1-monooxygenase
MFDHLKYLACFFYPACVVWFLYTGPHDAIGALLWTIPLWLIIIVDWLSPKIDPKKAKYIVADGYYDAILYALTILQFLIISLLLIYASQLQWDSVQEITTSIINLIVLLILVGTTSGSSAIIVAHELIHRSKSHQRILGRLLLYTVCYEHFVIAHIRGHHLSVATPEDIATARLDESFKSYWKRVTIGHFKYAWNSELERLGLTQTPVYNYKMLANSVLQGLLVEFYGCYSDSYHFWLGCSRYFSVPGPFRCAFTGNNQLLSTLGIGTRKVGKYLGLGKSVQFYRVCTGRFIKPY